MRVSPHQKTGFDLRGFQNLLAYITIIGAEKRGRAAKTKTQQDTVCAIPQDAGQPVQQRQQEPAWTVTFVELEKRDVQSMPGRVMESVAGRAHGEAEGHDRVA